MAGAPPAHLHTMKRLLRAGRIGTITHVSCVDRRGMRGLGPPQVDYVQLLAYGADHLAWVRDLLDVDPVRVMARCGRVPWQPAPHGSLTEVFLAMASGVHVQYHGSVAASRDQHELWIDGECGALRTDGSLVWFRKMGWPRFVPAAASLRGWTEVSSPAARAAARHERLERRDLDDQDRWPLAIAEAVIRADRSCRPVAVVEPGRPSAGHGSAA